VPRFHKWAATNTWAGAGVSQRCCVLWGSHEVSDRKKKKGKVLERQKQRPGGFWKEGLWGGVGRCYRDIVSIHTKTTSFLNNWRTQGVKGRQGEGGEGGVGLGTVGATILWRKPKDPSEKKKSKRSLKCSAETVFAWGLFSSLTLFSRGD